MLPTYAPPFHAIPYRAYLVTPTHTLGTRAAATPALPDKNHLIPSYPSNSPSRSASHGDPSPPSCDPLADIVPRACALRRAAPGRVEEAAVRPAREGRFAGTRRRTVGGEEVRRVPRGRRRLGSRHRVVEELLGCSVLWGDWGWHPSPEVHGCVRYR